MQGRSSNVTAHVDGRCDGNSLEIRARELEEEHKTATTNLNKITTDLKTIVGGTGEPLLPIPWLLTSIRSRPIQEV